MATEQRSVREGSEAPTELVRRSVATILVQTRAGGRTSLLVGALLGAVYVPSVGWPGFVAWYFVLALAMGLRQPYFNRLVVREGPTAGTLHRIALVAAATSMLGPASIPLFSRHVSVADLGILTIILVGWLAVAVAVLAVQPRVYAIYLACGLALVYLGWVNRVVTRELLLVGIAMAMGGPMLVRLARIVQGQLTDAVDAAQQNALLVDQLREALENQQVAQRARSRFLGAASHDLRQPVQALLFLSDIFRKTHDSARRDAMAQQIVRTGESIDGMFRHLVDFAQIDAGTMKAVVQPVLLDQLVAAAVTGFAEKCASRGLRFRLDLPGACTVAADPVLLERMLRNFLDNAFKYSLAGEIVLRVRPEGGTAAIEVCDEGVGMDAEDLAQACNAFHRGRSASLAEAEGIGLGLAISRHMSDLMQAGLRIESEPQRGTRVSVRLPLARGDEGVAARPCGDGGEALLRGRLVAVVENDRLAREALCAWLAEAGARVAAAGSPAQLLEVLAAAGTPPDLVLADYRLADGSGMDAVQAVRQAYGWVPAWILSGETEIADPALALPVLQKPITPDRLLEALRAAFPAQPAA